jgi:hypothetical protein
MVASVSERGYAATRISDLAELSGVSTNSFYGNHAQPPAPGQGGRTSRVDE